MTPRAGTQRLAGVMHHHDMSARRLADPVDMAHDCPHIARRIFIAARHCPRQRIDNNQNRQIWKLGDGGLDLVDQRRQVGAGLEGG